MSQGGCDLCCPPNDEKFNFNRDKTRTMQNEIRHQAQRLSRHPSIVIWDACNECEGHGFGITSDDPTNTGVTPWTAQNVPIQTLVEVDASRPVWPSCPSSGWSSGVNRLTGLPNGQPLIVAGYGANHNTKMSFPFVMERYQSGHRDTTANTITNTITNTTTTTNTTTNTTTGSRLLEYDMESHGPYVGLGGNGWPSANQAYTNTANLVMPPANTLPLTFFDPTTGAVPTTGCEWDGFFKSEFGCVSMSSFESLSAQLPGPEQWGIHAPSMFFRSWPVDCVLTAFFGEPQDGVGWNATGEAAFKKQLYLSQLGQALVQVRQIQEWRGNNVFGILFWMYNEVRY